MVTVTNEVLKCFFFINAKILSHLFFITTNNDKRYFEALAIFVNKKSVI
jgi:hypothetical protein